MPTWRLYFSPKLRSEGTEAQRPFAVSHYQRFMQEFFASPRLHALLERNDYRLLKIGDTWKVDADDHPDESQSPPASAAPQTRPSV